MRIRRMFNTPVWGWKTPFDELDRMRGQLDKFSEELEKGLLQRRWSGVFPLINVTEDKDNYQVRAELPGLKTDDLDISATGKTLTVSGERKIPSESKEVNYHRREREAGKFSRIVTLPNQIDPAKVEASLTDGVLTVVLPKAESAKPRQITIS
ncbi:Hsp20/alpha crystallin family protein [Desulfonema magnum]|uniref:Heat shock protein, Hsp 20 family n=1 Tax=Desulfonema magnum TaxID=45655 RepID=A0A975BRB6_9BACT|nr:Hsp20/alpha crystallin family protein [Desulfonema magnum]QTA90158.1 Heat shock protein, Hsp 20 family [Desulfonema magnum]